MSPSGEDHRLSLLDAGAIVDQRFVLQLRQSLNDRVTKIFGNGDMPEEKSNSMTASSGKAWGTPMLPFGI